MLIKQFVADITPVEDKGANPKGRMRRFVISTGAVDRDNDTIDANGWQLDNYKRNPVVLWAHDYSQLPVARALDVHVEGGNLIATAEFADHDFADTVLRLIDGGFLRATSVGFQPKKHMENVERGGLDFKEQELLEFSIVPVPANPQALITLGAADKDVQFVTKWANEWLKAITKVPAPKVPAQAPDDPVRWNRSLSKAFDVDGEPLQASTLEYTWVSRYLDTPVKELYETTLHVGGARLGAFLTALDDELAAFSTATVRNLGKRQHEGKEIPPVYETMQLNSKVQRTFLVAGIRFLHGPMKMVVKLEPSWAGIAVTSYVEAKGADRLIEFWGKVGQRASGYKFLKGESFSVSGEFLEKDGTSWADLFLPDTTLDPIKRTVKLLNEQGADMDARGQILMGPPGTGKTLAGRVMMNETKGVTFIWVSDRDMQRMGSFGSITQAFDLAQENAPSIVLLEDVDTDIGYQTDLLKTELDGLKRKQGVVTVLTTNHPDRLPKALIDRPGRFHDVLRIGLPGEDIRKQMLAKWAPDASAAVLDQLAKDTQGLSGAHLRDLVRFAETIRTQDGLALDEALGKAHQKVVEQREIIAQAQQTQTYRSVKALSPLHIGTFEKDGWQAREVIKHAHGGGAGTCSRCGSEGDLAAGVCGKCANELQPWDEDALVARVAQFAKGSHAFVARLASALGLEGDWRPDAQKQGRVLSRANESRVRQAKDLLDEVLTQLAAIPVEEATGEGDKAAMCPHGYPGGAGCPTCGKAAEPLIVKADEPFFELADDITLELADEEPTFEIDTAVLRDTLSGLVKDVLRDAVRESTVATFARLRGRVD